MLGQPVDLSYLFRHGTLLIFVVGVLYSGAGIAGGSEQDDSAPDPVGQGRYSGR
jgi:hypothetical protein